MNKNCAFTICTRSYIGLARTLKDSFIKYNENFDFFIIFADYENTEQEDILNGEDIINLGKDKYLELAFKYNVTEFCTAIKPFGMTYFFNKGYSTVAYLDPDILFYSRFNELYEDYSVFLTPHVLKILPNLKNDWGEEQFLKFGVYNCGFVGLYNDENGRLVAKWWETQLLNKAFSDAEGGMYTDQKWMDMVPSFIPLNRINIIRNLGCDIAPWNYSERKCIFTNEKYSVCDRENEEIQKEICFVHYSAYNYKKLLETGDILSKYNLTYYSDEDVLINNYRKELLNHKTLDAFSIPYKFNKFDNGKPIMPFHRRIYRQILEDGIVYNNPFETENNSFYKLLKKSKLLCEIDVSQVTVKEMKNFSKENKKVEIAFGLLLKILGVNKYALLLRKLVKLSRFESNTFLLKK